MNADRVAIERFVENVRKASGTVALVSTFPGLVGHFFRSSSHLNTSLINPSIQVFFFTFLVLAASHGAEGLFAEALVPLAREHLRSTSSNRDAA
jgi:hypothetical protein